MLPHDAPATAVTVLSLTLIGGSVALWIRAAGKWTSGQAAVAREPHRPVPWSMVDAAMVFMVWIVLLAALPELCILAGGGSETMTKVELHYFMMAGPLLANLIAFAFGAGWLAARERGSMISAFSLDNGGAISDWARSVSSPPRRRCICCKACSRESGHRSIRS